MQQHHLVLKALTAIAAVLALTAAGCGLKYDLYLPDEEQSTQQHGGAPDHSADGQVTLFSTGGEQE